MDSLKFFLGVHVVVLNEWFLNGTKLLCQRNICTSGLAGEQTAPKWSYYLVWVKTGVSTGWFGQVCTMYLY